MRLKIAAGGRGSAADCLVARPQNARPQNASPDQALLNQYCIGCHNEKTKTAGLMLDKLDLTHPGQDPETWEKVVRKVRAGMMPPSGMPRPARPVLDSWASNLEAGLDRAAAAKPNPGSTGLHRLNRTEYTNAIRDLLAIDVDAAHHSSRGRFERRVRQHCRRTRGFAGVDRAIRGRGRKDQPSGCREHVDHAVDGHLSRAGGSFTDGTRGRFAAGNARRNARPPYVSAGCRVLV